LFPATRVSLTYKPPSTIPLSHPIPSAAIHFRIYIQSQRDRRIHQEEREFPSDLSHLTMVVALGPGRFYGSGLPRPRVFPGDRVDPPAPVTDALLCWAREAHWSMGGLCAKRLRLQGRIEGNLVKLRRAARRNAKARANGEMPPSLDALGSDDDESDQEEVEAQERALRREVVDEEEESDSSESDEEEVALVTIAAAAKRKRARKLVDEFDRVAPQQEEEGGKKKKQKPAAVTPAKASPKGKAAAAAAAPAPAPAAAAPVKTSLKKKAAVAKTSPKRKAAEAPAARRTSPRSKH
jgi:hypothetical protein